MRKFCFLAVAVAVLAMATAERAQAGGRRTRYYSYGGTATVSQRATGQAAQSSTTRRYSYGPTTANGSAVRYSYSPNYNGNRQPSSWRADRKILGTGY
ncbi:MAG TPA: hypothetical protein VNH11_23280 [Pirellulales bacterium]|nr:hypothetical protein [Pirellulales bacterium]